jgi:hypothetical protein
MSSIVIRSAQRRSVRRALHTACWAVRLDDCSLLGEQILDLSPRGVLLACDAPVEPDKPVFISFRAPGSDDLWLNAEAEVARVVNGLRVTDPGYCLGLRLTYFDALSRIRLERRLRGLPPPIPRRRMRADYADTIRRIAFRPTVSGRRGIRPYTALARRIQTGPQPAVFC